MENIEFFAIYIWIMIIVFFDGLLTFYQIYLVDKKGLNGIGLEKNKIMKKLFGKKITPLKFVLLEIITQIYIYFIVKLFSLITELFLGLIIGMFIMVNLYHYYNIEKIKRMWNNNHYWKGLEEDLKSRK